VNETSGWGTNTGQLCWSVDPKTYAFFHAMLEQGIFLPPSKFEAWFIGLDHGQDHIDRTIAAAKKAMKSVGRVAASGSAGENAPDERRA